MIYFSSSSCITEIPVLTACGLVWTVILSVSAGNVSSSDKEEVIDGDAIEENVVLELGAEDDDLTESSSIPAKKNSKVEELAN